MLVALTASCSDWTQTESVETKVRQPWEQDPALWARYMTALRSYKADDSHFIAYARLDNAQVGVEGEQQYLRCLPDSLDIVSLTNGDNFSKYDTEDMDVMREKGTRVIYQVNYAGRKAEFSDAAKLGAYLDKVVASVAANGLDGYSFTVANVNDTEAAALIMSKLAADESKLLVFEGNPMFVPSADRAKVDFFVLNTEKTQHTSDVALQVRHAMDYSGIPAEKLILAAESSNSLYDEERVEHAAIGKMTELVVTTGPLKGIAVYNFADDYYHGGDINYSATRRAVQLLNPSK